VKEATQNGARLSRCAEVIGLSPRTLKRWQQDLNGPATGDKRPIAKRPPQANQLTKQERQDIIDICPSPRFASSPPAQIVTTLLDEGTYLASESTFYRILADHRLNKRRGRARKPAEAKPRPNHQATCPNQVWAWDITWLPSQVSGIYYKLYFILDLYSRKIVGSEVFAEENADNSNTLLQRAYLSENIATQRSPLVLHGDNGSPLKAATVLGLMHQLEITPSHSRPRVSNDNAFSEALFRTTKYHPGYPPNGFSSLTEAQEWAHRFVTYYNTEHKHRSLNFVTPIQKHHGQDAELLQKRKKLLEAKRKENPTRWINGTIRNCQPSGQVNLYPLNNRTLEKYQKNAA
jgi:putative transposase